MTTPNLSLTTFTDMQEDWGDGMNGNLTAIDTGHGVLAAHSKLNVADMTNPAVPVVDLSKGRIVLLNLTVPVTSCTIENATDGYISFHIVQPAGGFCPFTWPTSFRDGGDISVASGTTSANSVSRQTFAYNSTLGAAYAVAPMLTGAK